MKMYGGRVSTALLSSCVATFSELIQKAPEWVSNVSRIKNIIESLDARLFNDDWPGLTALHGKSIEWTQVLSDPSERIDQTIAPRAVVDWAWEALYDDTKFSARDRPNVRPIPNDRTHVMLVYPPKLEDEDRGGRRSRVSVARLFDKYNAPPEIRKLMTMLPSKSTMDRVQVEISTDPVDILRKSTGQFWHSCESCGGSSGHDYSAGNFTDIEQKNAIAIIRKNRSIDTKGSWSGRVMLRSCTDDEGRVNVGIEPRIYQGDEKREATSPQDVIRKVTDWLSEDGLGPDTYTYCYTPYEYAGYSDQMSGGGTIVYGDQEQAVEGIVKKQIAKVRDEMDWDGVCKRQYPSQSESLYYQGNLANLYEKDMRLKLDGGVSLYLINNHSFEEVTQCQMDYDLDAYFKWKRGNDKFNEVMEKLAKVFENDVYIVSGQAEAYDKTETRHLFAPGCEAVYNRSSYISKEDAWPARFTVVEPWLDEILHGRMSDEYLAQTKKVIIANLRPWNDMDTHVQLLDEATAKGPFTSEDISRYCYELESENHNSRRPSGSMHSVGNGFVNVGFTDEGKCPIESEAMDILQERCNIRAKLHLGVRGGGTEVFSSVDEVGPRENPDRDARREQIERHLEAQGQFLSRQRERLRQYQEEHPGELPPIEYFPGDE